MKATYFRVPASRLKQLQGVKPQWDAVMRCWYLWTPNPGLLRDAGFIVMAQTATPVHLRESKRVVRWPR